MSDQDEVVVEDTPLNAILAKQAESGDDADTDVKPDDKSAEEISDSQDTEDADAETSKDEKAEEEDQGKDELADVKAEIKGLHAALKEARDQTRRLREMQEEEPEELTSFDEDPDKALEERLAKRMQVAENRFYVLCENLVKESHDDFDDFVTPFMEECEKDTALAGQVYQAMSADPNPALYLYNFAKNRAATKEFGGDVTKLRESIEKPLKAENAKLSKRVKELEDQLSNLDKIKPSLNDEPSATKTQVDDESASQMTPLEDIVGPRRKAG